MRLGALVWLSFGVSPVASAADDLKAFPAADAGFQRHVLRLPALPTETDSRLEVIVGKEVDMDCNHTWFTGDLQTVAIPGWGFDRFVVQTARPATTLRGCATSERHRAFAQVRGAGFLMAYSSQLPVVVYVPVGFEVRYRLWTPGSEVLPIAME